MNAPDSPIEWHGPRPLPNPLGVARLGVIYSNTAAFYDGLVAEKQAAAKLKAVDLLQRQVGERFLEVGAGTGWAFAHIVQASGVQGAYALDVAPGMLAVARDALAVQGIASPALLLGDGRALPFADAAIDCILNSYTFEVLPEHAIPGLIDETLRVLRPSGRAVIVNLTDATDGGEADEAMIQDWKQRYVTDPEYFGGARPLQLAPMLAAHGFEVVSRSYVGPDWPSEVILARRRD